MEIDQEDLTIEQTAEGILRTLRQRELDKMKSPPGAGFRNTYTAANAAKFKPYFAKALNEQVNVVVPYREHATLKVKRLHQLLCDSLSWLINNDPDESARALWAVFRTQITYVIASDADDGIHITWKTSATRHRLRARHVEAAGGVLDTGNSIMKEVIAWMEGDRAEMFVKRNLNLSLETQQQVKKLLETAGFTDAVVKIDRVLIS